ncbi:hypothetical protein AB0G02_26125, partial [Actinosynnema sp. NPDC023658]
MTWLIWRQHRTEVCVLGLLVGMFGVALLVLGAQAHDLFPGGPARCAGEARINDPRRANRAISTQSAAASTANTAVNAMNDTST